MKFRRRRKLLTAVSIRVYRSRITEGEDMPDVTDFDDRRKFQVSGIFRSVRRTFWRSDWEGSEELKAELIRIGFDRVDAGPA